MRTLVISDIHIDVSVDYDVVGDLARYAKSQKVECIIIAGDISENVELTLPAIDEIEQLSGAQVLYVPGNHDMWEPNRDNDTLYERYCADSRCLCGRPRKVGNHVVIGDIGWYDYCFGDERYGKKDFDRMEYEGRVWNDKKRNKWTDDNKGKSQWFLERIEQQLEQYKDEDIVVVTHMLPHIAFTVPPEEFKNINWYYFNAFLGTDKLGKLYRKYNVKYAICGHVHFRFDVKDHGITYMCRCLNYDREWIGNKDCALQIAEASSIIEL